MQVNLDIHRLNQLTEGFRNLRDNANLPSPVLALTIVDQSTLNHGLINGKTKLLVVVRDPDTNITHPNVVSVPTHRITIGTFLDILSTVKMETHSTNSASYCAGDLVSNVMEKRHHPVVSGVQDLLTGKLGLSDQLESKKVVFDAVPCVVTQGVTYRANQTSVSKEYGETISMLNVLVIVSNAAAFPSRTSSYSRIFWTEVDEFLQSVSSKNPAMLDEGLDPIVYCIHGLCISTTYNLLSRKLHYERNTQSPG